MVQSVDGGQVHVRTVLRHLEKEGLKAFVQQKKPGLTSIHTSDRYEFAKAHLHWTVDDWKNVMFPDETSISRVGSFGRQFYYSNREHKRFKPHQVKESKQSGGGKIMVWGCMTYYGVGDASWIPQKATSMYSMIMSSPLETGMAWIQILLFFNRIMPASTLHT